MVCEKELNLNRIFVSETEKSTLVYDRDSGNLHYTNDSSELESVLQKILAEPERESLFVKTEENVFKLNLSTVCNLNCDYCFRDKQSHISTDVEKAKKIIDFIIDDYAPHMWMYSFSVNLTSESLIELEKIKKIKSYIDERTRPGFNKKDFRNLESAQRYLACFPGVLLKDFHGFDDLDAIIDQLNNFIGRRDMLSYFPVPDGIVLPEWEANQLRKLKDLNDYSLREINLRMLEVLFPETFLRKPHYAFYICTNGTVFNDDVVSFFKEIKLETVCISLDGPSSVHNLHRFFNDNSSSHSVVIENIKKFMDAGLKVSVAAVITKDYPYPLQLVEYFKSLGVLSVTLSVVRAGVKGSFTEKSIDNLLDGYKMLFNRIYDDVIKQDYSLVDLLKDDVIFSGVKLLLGKNRIVKRCKWNENTIFDEKGDIYPCDYFIGKSRYIRGNISSPVVQDVFDDKLMVDDKETCRNCWCKYLCGGTCYYNSLVNNGDIAVPDPVECKFSKGLRELSLIFVQKLLDAGFDVLDFVGRLGFDFGEGIFLSKRFEIKNGIAFSLRGTLTKVEMEIKKIMEYFQENKVELQDKIFLTVLGMEDSKSNKILEIFGIIPTINRISETLLIPMDCKIVTDFDFGKCISGESFSDDKSVEDLKERIKKTVQNYKIPVKANLWYEASMNAFLGYKKENISVFVQRRKNVY